MERGSTSQVAPTRREYMKYGGTIIGGCLLAGCASDTDTEPTPPNTSEADGSYTVTMAPMGAVEFEEPPKNAFTVLVHHADMALALGHGDDVNAMYLPEYFGDLYDIFLEQLDGVSVEWATLQNSWNISKEALYELDSDVHLADPAYVTKMMDSLDTDDVEEVREQIAPWFGNSLSGQHSDPPAHWADRYQYYTLWKIFEKVAQVFRAEARYEALAEIHSELLSTIESNLPSEDERPRTARIQISPSGLDEGIWAYSMTGPGFNRAHTRPFGVADAFPDMQEYTRIDREALVAAAPDVILRTASMGPDDNWVEVRNQLESDPVVQQIPAVENGRIHPLAVRYGGPIMNLFQLEMCAKELYPDQFGEWPRYDGESYPDIPADERMFDRQRVADIINGNL